MKKINNKGFTLIELLVVLVLLVVIMSIAIPSVTSSIERSKDKQLEQKIELLSAEGEIYYDAHKNSASGVIDAVTLIKNCYITKEQAKDPTNEGYPIKGCYVVGSGWDTGCSYYDTSALSEITPSCS